MAVMLYNGNNITNTINSDGRSDINCMLIRLFVWPACLPARSYVGPFACCRMYACVYVSPILAWQLRRDPTRPAASSSCDVWRYAMDFLLYYGKGIPSIGMDFLLH
jgi:hypothetical protein